MLPFIQILIVDSKTLQVRYGLHADGIIAAICLYVRTCFTHAKMNVVMSLPYVYT